MRGGISGRRFNWNYVEAIFKNPKGFAFLRKAAMQYPSSKKRMIQDCIHYCSSSQIAKNRKYIQESPRKLLTVLCTPLGWALTEIIRNKAKENG